MGQAFDRDGNVLGEAYGETKREVFDKLIGEFKNAHEIRIRSMEDRIAETNPNQAASIEMPRYRCHKEVWALQIAGISLPQNEAGDAELGFTDLHYAPRLMPRAWLDKHNPEVGGYLVVYKDGYQSFSPAAAFEEGYTRI